jgi:hypothetical protein
MKSAALIAIVLAATGAGCKEQPVKLKGTSSLGEARAYQGFPVYYAGDEVAGFPLTAVNREEVTAPPGTSVASKLRGARNVSSFDFLYGSCGTPSKGEGCSLPLSIQVWPACARYPALYDSNFPGTPTPKKTRIRGVPAAYFEGGYRLEIQTGATTIVIFGGRRKMRTAVAALEGLNVDVRPGQKLPPPVPGALDGSLPCA